MYDGTIPEWAEYNLRFHYGTNWPERFSMKLGPNGPEVRASHPPPLFTIEWDWRQRARAGDLPTAEAMGDARLAETCILVDDIPRGYRGHWIRMKDGERVTLAGLIIHRKLTAPSGASTEWEIVKQRWTPLPPTVPPVEAKALMWAAKRLSGKYERGRPPVSRSLTSDQMATRDRLLAELTPIIQELRAAEYEPTQQRVIDALWLGGGDPARDFKRRVRAAGYENWHTLLADIPDADTSAA